MGFGRRVCPCKFLQPNPEFFHLLAGSSEPVARGGDTVVDRGIGRSGEGGGDEVDGCWSAIASLTGGADGLMTALLATRFCTALFCTVW